MNPPLTKFALRLILITVFIALLVGIIAYARGYRYDTKSNLVTPTGIIAVSAFPRTAKVYVNGVLKGVTDLTVTLPPGEYHIDVRKEGFTSWSKDLTVKGELVLTLDVLLYPINPALSPLTNLGITKAIPVEQSEKVVLFSEAGDETKDGIYLFESSKGPLSLLSPLKLIMLKKNLPVGLDFSTAQMYFSPDYKQAILELGYLDNPEAPTISYLISLEEENLNQFDITLSKDTLIEAWTLEKNDDRMKILETFDKDFVKIASDSFDIVDFSPDETKILYHVNKPVELPIIITPRLISTNQTPEVRALNPAELYVYDRKEDRNYLIPILDAENLIASGEVYTSVGWYPDSKHIAFKEIPPTVITPERGTSPTPAKSRREKISIIDFDGTNKQTVYAGPFTPSFFKIAPDGRIIIMTNFNSEDDVLSDLYAIGIK